MAKRNDHSFKKYQRELKKKKKAEEKMARRQGKKEKDDGIVDSDQAGITEQDKDAESAAPE